MGRRAEWKDKQFQILCRIDEICRQCGIEVFLSGDTALRAYRKNALSDYVSVCIDINDVERFVEAVEQDGTYRVRGMFNYPTYPGFDLKIYDPTTIDFDITKYRERGFVGLYVTVKFIRHISESPRKSSRARKVRKTFKDFAKEKNTEVQTKDYRRLKLYRTLSGVMSQDKLAKKVFGILCSLYGGESSTYYVNGVNYPCDFFDSKRPVCIRDRVFYIPRDVETYFRGQYGLEWRAQAVGLRYRENKSRFRDGTHTWEEYQKFISYIDLDEYEKNAKQTRKINQEIKPSKKVVLTCYDLLERTHLRFAFWQDYYGQKDHIVWLYKQSDFDALYVLLQPYLEQMLRFKRKKMAICFDDDIYEIALETMKAKGMISEKDSEKLKSYVPEEHHETIRIKNYRGDYI